MPTAEILKTFYISVTFCMFRRSEKNTYTLICLCTSKLLRMFRRSEEHLYPHGFYDCKEYSAFFQDLEDFYTLVIAQLCGLVSGSWRRTTVRSPALWRPRGGPPWQAPSTAPCPWWRPSRAGTCVLSAMRPPWTRTDPMCVQTASKLCVIGAASMTRHWQLRWDYVLCSAWKNAFKFNCENKMHRQHV